MLLLYTIPTPAHLSCIHLDTLAHPLFFNKVQKPAVNQRLTRLPPINLFFSSCETSRHWLRTELSLPTSGVVLDLVRPSLLRLGAHHYWQLVASRVPPHTGRGTLPAQRQFSAAHAPCMSLVYSTLNGRLTI